MPQEIKCRICGKVFRVPPTRTNTAKYCSTECKYIGQSEIDSKVERVCNTCGKIFSVWPSTVEYGGGLFCSVECSNNFRGKRRGSQAFMQLGNRYNLDLKEMSRLYLDEKMGTPEIAKIFGVSQTLISNYLKKHGVKLRSNKEAQLVRVETGKSLRENNGNWRGGRKYSHGYVDVYMPEHPKANKKYVKEHVIVWEKTNGMSVPDGFSIHHLNGVKDDNRPENLVAVSNSEHRQIHGCEPYKLRIRELEDYITELELRLQKG